MIAPLSATLQAIALLDGKIELQLRAHKESGEEMFTWFEADGAGELLDTGVCACTLKEAFTRASRAWRAPSWDLLLHRDHTGKLHYRAAWWMANGDALRLTGPEHAALDDSALREEAWREFESVGGVGDGGIVILFGREE